MGTWAVVLSMSSVANMANMGIGTSVVRLTAKFSVNKDTASINRLVHTSLIVLGSFFLLLSLLIYIIAPFWLKAVIEPSHLSAAMSLVPFSLASLLINAVSSVFLSCLDGFQKNFVRSTIYIFSSVLLLVLTFRLVPQYGILGVAYAQLIQSVVFLFSSVVSLKLAFRSFGLFPIRWDKSIFKTIFSFGVKEQIISICQLCFDPLTKSLLSGMGSLSMVTYYEMANRFIIQLRSLLISANQVLVPVFAGIEEKVDVDAKHNLYRKVYSLNLVSTVLWAAILSGVLIPVSKLWIGEYRSEFFISGLALIAGWGMNLISSPAYFSNMGTGKINDNVISNIVICGVNLVFGYTLGTLLGGYGVITAWGAALGAGAFYVVKAYQKKNFRSSSSIMGVPDLQLLVCGILYSLLCNFIFFQWKEMGIVYMLLVNAALLLILCLVPVLRHPGIKSLSSSTLR